MPLESISVNCRAGVHDGQRQPREAATRADIGDARAGEVRADREAVEKVVRQHLLAALDGGEVVAAVPALELIEHPEQAGRVAGREADAEKRGIADQALGRAQRTGSVNDSGRG
ncbi:MAG TPA: hypothetical protein VM713_03515 [Steroidobacteraceae bacterium]|nr:hypothetical protein [Steroidobacteraceae bacterium]